MSPGKLTMELEAVHSKSPVSSLLQAFPSQSAPVFPQSRGLLQNLHLLTQQN